MTQSNPESFSKKVVPPRKFASRRKRKRPTLYRRADERSIFLGNLTHAATPAASFFPLSILAGLVLAAAILFDLRPLYILAALAAPFMAPLAGLVVATVSGSIRFFFQSLGAMLIGCGLVFSVGALGGLAAGTWPEFFHTSTTTWVGFTWADDLLLLVGTIFLAIRLYRDPQENPRLASAALAYEMYLPAALAGYGLGIHSPTMLQNGLVVLVMHMALASITGVIVFIILGLRLRLRENFSLSGSIFLTAITILTILGCCFGANGSLISTFTNASTPTTTCTASLPTKTAVQTTPPMATRTLSVTPSATKEIVFTLSPEPTFTGTNTITTTPQPYTAIVRVSGSTGAFVRKEPAGEVITSVLNGTWVEVLPEQGESLVNNVAWVYIRTNDNIEGWMMKSLLDIRTSTPSP